MSPIKHLENASPDMRMSRFMSTKNNITEMSHSCESSDFNSSNLSKANSIYKVARERSQALTLNKRETLK